VAWIAKYVETWSADTEGKMNLKQGVRQEEVEKNRNLLGQKLPVEGEGVNPNHN
jgi:hypothetical protein